MKHKIFAIYYFALLTLVAIFLVVNFKKIFANDIDEKALRTAKLGNDPRGDYIVKYYKDDILLVQSGNTANLTGFEDEVKPCEDFSLNIEGTNYLCLIGEVGVHSQNIELINKETFLPLKFIRDDIESSSLTSDTPKFDLNFNEIVSHNRDYNKDPIVDSLLDIYKFRDGKFVFDKTLQMP